VSGFLGLTGGTGALGALSLLAEASAFVGLGQLQLRLGPVIFNENTLEVPEEIGNLAGVQVIEQHDFPGGVRTQQTYGAFPIEIGWRGLFTGTNALTRALAVDQLRVAGQPVTLSYGPKSFVGRIVEFTIRPKTQWFIHYTIRFLPLLDLSSGNSSTTSAETIMAQQNGVLSNLLGGMPFPLPAGLTSAIDSLQSTLAAQLQLANGLVQNIALPGLQVLSAAVTVVVAATPLVIANGSSQDAYMAASAANSATIIGNTAAQPKGTASTITVINPSLPGLSAQYLGDATQWPTLAAYNNINPPVPFPNGTFNLKIPA